MIVSQQEEFRIQRWDGEAWRQGGALTAGEAQRNIKARRLSDPGLTLRIVKITTTRETFDAIGIGA